MGHPSTRRQPSAVRLKTTILHGEQSSGRFIDKTTPPSVSMVSTVGLKPPASSISPRPVSVCHPAPLSALAHLFAYPTARWNTAFEILMKPPRTHHNEWRFWNLQYSRTQTDEAQARNLPLGSISLCGPTVRLFHPVNGHMRAPDAPAAACQHCCPQLLQAGFENGFLPLLCCWLFRIASTEGAAPGQSKRTALRRTQASHFRSFSSAVVAVADGDGQSPAIRSMYRGGTSFGFDDGYFESS